MKIQRNRKIFQDRYLTKNVDYINFNLITGLNWYSLLIDFSFYSVHCNWSKLDKEDWYFLLVYHPQFKKYRNEDTKK